MKGISIQELFTEAVNEVMGDASLLTLEPSLKMEAEKITIIRAFIKYAKDKLKIEGPVKVYLCKDRNSTVKTTAAFVPHSSETHIKAGGRALIDILRSIGHELAHQRQIELKVFDPKVKQQDIGGKIENQANAISGILIKDFTQHQGYANAYDY